jgi:hypothetical protein
MLLIGGHALKYYVPSFKTDNRLKDFDLICTYEEFDRWAKNNASSLRECYPIDDGKKMIVKTESNIFEFEIAWPGSSGEELLNHSKNKVLHWNTAFTPLSKENVQIASLNSLFSLKMSHRFLRNSPHFLKTMRDIQLMKDHGATIPDDLKDWFKRREKETYWYKHPNLNQGKSGFFNPNEGVQYVYDHDSIHEAVAQLDKPAYEYYKGDDQEVLCDKNKFFSVDEAVRLYGVLEEAYVLAIERSQVPFKGKVPPRWSFEKALEKVCTSITSGWFRAYAYDNYDKVLNLYNPDYANLFWSKVEQGKVKPYDKANAIY